MLPRQKVAPSREVAANQIAEHVLECNEDLLHSAIGYITPKEKLESRDNRMFKERDQKLEATRGEPRKQKLLEMRSALASVKTSTTADTIIQLTRQPRLSISC